MSARTPQLAEVLRVAIRSALLDVRTALPCRVETYDVARQVVNVTPGFRRVYRRDGADVEVEMPVIPDVPVAWPRAGGAVLTLPLAAGDTGLVVICDRALDRWRDGDGGPLDPADGRHHHATDAVFIPGLHVDGDAIPADGASDEDVVLGWEDGSAQVRVRPSGVVQVRAETVNVDGDAVNLGADADAYLVRGTEFQAWFAALQAWQAAFAASCAAALCAAPGNPLAPPIVCPPLPELPAGIVSAVTRTA